VGGSFSIKFGARKRILSSSMKDTQIQKVLEYTRLVKIKLN
jgi:hypothetical protein